MASTQPVPAQNLRAVAVQAARKYGVDPGIFTRQIAAESGFDPSARSGAGAVGVAQFMPATAKSYGIDPTNPIESLDAAARYDANELKAFGGDYHKALAAYNAGAGNADKWNDPNFAGGQTYNYVRKILGGAGAPAAASQAAPLASGPVSHPGQAAAPVAGNGLNAQLLARIIRSNDQILGVQAPANLAALFGQQPQLPHATVAAPTPQPSQPQAPLPGAKLPADTAALIHGNTQGEQATFLNDLAKLAQYEHAPVEINSGYRSLAKQQQLWNDRASNPNPVAQPGHSLHEQGLAADGTVGGVPLGRLPAALLARFGLATVPGDPVHIQIAGGR